MKKGIEFRGGLLFLQSINQPVKRHKTIKDMKIKEFLITAVCCLCSLQISAYDFEADGIYYNIISAGADSVEVTYSERYGNDYKGDVVIPAGVVSGGKTYRVTGIGSYAFYYNDYIKTVSIPKTITEIYYHTFSSCDSLTAITVHADNPKFSSMDGVLYNKNRTTIVRYPCGIASKDFTFPSTVDSVGYDAFYYCNKLETVTFSEKLRGIDDYAFESCSKLKSLKFPSSLRTIGYYAFYGCHGLKELEIPGTVTNIDMYAFASCQNLVKVTLLDGRKTISYGMFRWCYALKEVTIPSSVTSISYYAFGYCRALETLAIPESVAEISSYAFYDCTNLSEISLPSGLASIGYYAFYGCKFPSVTIPASVTVIGGNAFGGANLTTIKVDASNPNYTAADGVLLSKDKNTLYLVPETLFKDSVYSVPTYVKTLGEDLFYSVTKLKRIILPYGLETIDDYAFQYCSGLKLIDLPGSLKTIGYASFEHSGLDSIVIPSSVASISAWAFTKCYTLKYIRFEGKVDYIGYNAFAGYGDDPYDYTVEVCTEPFKIEGGLGLVDLEHSTLIVPDGRKAQYLATNGWKDFGTIIEKSKVGMAPVAVDRVAVRLTGNVLTVSTPYREQVSVYDMTGRLLKRFAKGEGEVAVDVAVPRGHVAVIQGSRGWSRKVAARQ